eukprot:COSAG01_NODE_25_length_37050_cov_211.559119_5_plen_56_part_00
MVSGGVTFASVAAVCLVVLPSVVAQAPVSGDCAVFSTVRPPPPLIATLHLNIKLA